MKFAFLIMGDYDSKKDVSTLHNGQVRTIGVGNIEEACDVAVQLQADGFGCIELCGAFEEDGAKKVIAATGGTLPVGYVVHLAEQDELFDAAFSK